MFHVSHFSQHPPTSWSSSCYQYDVFFRKESRSPAGWGWPWNGEGVLGALRCVGSTVFGWFECQLLKFKETIRIKLGQDSLVDFQGVAFCHRLLRIYPCDLISNYLMTQ